MNILNKSNPKKLLREIKSAFKKAQAYNFTIGHGLDIRERIGFTLPKYQRGAVWTDAQKSRFVESIWLGLPIGVWCYDRSYLSNGEKCDLLDGQQRWSAIYDFVDGKIPAFGLYWGDLEEADRKSFGWAPFPGFLTNDLSEKDKREIYDRLAYGGTVNVKGESIGKARKMGKKL